MTDSRRRDLLYSKEFACPFCGARIVAWRIYPTARPRVERMEEYFDVPYYESPDPHASFCDFLLVEVRVCPGCLFATNDDSHFEAAWTPGDRTVVGDHMKDRRALAAGAKDLQAFPRTEADALVALKLAIHSSTAIYNASPRERTVELARMGNYALKAAVLSTRLGQPDRVPSWHKAAMEYLRRAFDSDLRGPTLPRTLYQIAALGIRYGDDRAASKSFEYLRDFLKREPTRDASRYFERLRKIWEDREFNRAKP